MRSFPAGVWVLNCIFVICLITLAAGAMIAVLSTRLIRGVVGLAICCIGLAGLFYFLHSPFLALMEILIYVGAVCVTMVFAIMLAEPDEPAKVETRAQTLLWGGAALVVPAVIFWGIWIISTGHSWAIPARVGDGSLQGIGKALLTQYSLAFELISLALLVAILGALAVARGGRHKG